MYNITGGITENNEKMPMINSKQGITCLLMPMELVSTVDFGLRSNKQPSQAQT